jgi:nitrite reductase/ring-hydroxylating ferredoxin subunit
MGAAYREIIGALWRQRADENFEVERSIPTVPPAELDAPRLGFTRPDGSADLGPLDLIEVGTVSRVDVGTGTFAVARVDSDRVIVIDGRCTHGNAHLGDGAIVTTADGPCIECPKHNGRFDLATGSPCRKPVTVAVDVHSISLDAGHIIVAPPTEELTT